MTSRIVSLVALAGIVTAILYAAGVRARMKWQEDAAAEALAAVVNAQRAFRDGGGRGGYATSLASLTTPCPSGERPTMAGVGASGYDIRVRAAAGTSAAGTDCHGRSTALDFVASAVPARPGVDGLRAMSVSAAGRTFVFFDGIAPREADMAAGGLAMPLDALTPIP